MTMHMHDILAKHLATVRGMRPEGYELQILETGTIRQDTEAHRLGDGWSTRGVRRARCRARRSRDQH